MAHLDDATALAYAAGALRGEAFEAALVHIDACAACRLLVASAAGAGGSGPPASIGRFVVERVAGRGAMGVVYRAHDPRLDRAVAIKTLRGDAFAGEARARFEREARALARIDHPNVVRIYEVGEHAGELFLAMELVDGLTVEAWLARAPRRPAEIVDVFVQAANGLLAAHQAGLVHRDFKPSNAMIDADGRVRVTDFGLVHLGEAAAPIAVELTDDAGTELTRTGAVVGTPAYLAPELFARALDPQAEAEPGVGPEPRSDQFSLCVALYEALAGHRPFEATDLRGLGAAIDRGPRPPRRPIPRRLHRALRRGLAVAPGDRFPSMRELIEAVAPRSYRRWYAGGALAIGIAAATVAAWVTRSAPAPAPVTAAPLVGACPEATTRWDAVWNDPRKAALRAAQVASWPAVAPAGTKPAVAERWEALIRLRATMVVDDVQRFGEQWRSRYQDVCAAQTWSEIARRRCLDDALGRFEALVVAGRGQGLNQELTVVQGDLARCGAHQVNDLDVPEAAARPVADKARALLAHAAALRVAGLLDAAASAAEHAIAAGTTIKSPSLLAEAWLERGQIARAAGEVQASLDAWREALDQAAEVGHDRVIRHATDALAAQYTLGAGDRALGERWLRAADALDDEVPPSDAERAERLRVRAHLAR